MSPDPVHHMGLRSLQHEVLMTESLAPGWPLDPKEVVVGKTSKRLDFMGTIFPTGFFSGQDFNLEECLGIDLSHRQWQ